MIEHLGPGRVELGHDAAPLVVVHADREAVPGGRAGEPLGMAPGQLTVRCREERREPDPGRAPRRGDVGRDPRDARREPFVGIEPIADRSLIPVVDLEHVERPRVGEREVVTDDALADVTEVLVPRAPPDEERRADTSALGGADPRGPRFQQRRRVVAVFDRDRVQRARRARFQDGAAQPRLGTQLHPAVDDPRPQGARVVLTAGEADTTQMWRGRRQHGDLFGSQLARARDARIRVERGPHQRERTRIVRRVPIDAEPHRASGRPRLVPVHEYPRVVAGRPRVPHQADGVERDPRRGVYRPLQLAGVAGDVDEDRSDLVAAGLPHGDVDGQPAGRLDAGSQAARPRHAPGT